MDRDYLRYLAGKHKFNLGILEKDYYLTKTLKQLSESSISKIYCNKS